MTESSEKQFDPRMHSAEHIVNQTMIRMFGSARCFSAHIERKKSKNSSSKAPSRSKLPKF